MSRTESDPFDLTAVPAGTVVQQTPCVAADGTAGVAVKTVRPCPKCGRNGMASLAFVIAGARKGQWKVEFVHKGRSFGTSHARITDYCTWYERHDAPQEQPP